MTATLSASLITPSVLSTTMTGCKCSEIFLMNEDRTESFGGGSFATALAGWNELIGNVGPLVRINSEGWSTLLVWEILDATNDKGNNTECIFSTVMGLRPAFNSTATGEGILDSSGNVYVNATTQTIKGFTGPFRWQSCPVMGSKKISHGRHGPTTGDDDGANATPISPPMGCHSSGDVFTFNKGPKQNAGGNLQPDKDATEVKFSSTNNTYLTGPAVIDVSSTIQILHYPINTELTTQPGYLVGQFIS